MPQTVVNKITCCIKCNYIQNSMGNIAIIITYIEIPIINLGYILVLRNMLGIKAMLSNAPNA